MAYTDDWRTLQNRIAADHTVRAAALDALRTVAAQTLSAYGETRRTHARAAHATRGNAHTELRQRVAAQLTDIETARQTSAAAQRAALQANADAQRHEVAALLRALAVQRSAQAIVQREQLAAYAAELRNAVAAHLAVLDTALTASASAQRRQIAEGRARLAAENVAWLGNAHSHAAATQSYAHPDASVPTDTFAALLDLSFALPEPPLAPVASPPPAAPANATIPQSFNQAGIYAYAKLARVAILKALDAGGAALTGEQRQNLNAYVDGLRRNVAPFLSMLAAVQPTMDDEQRQSMRTYVDDLRENIGVLAAELATVTRIMPAPQHPDGAYIATLHADVEHLLSEIASIYQTLAGSAAQPTETVAPARTAARRRRGRGEASEESL